MELTEERKKWRSESVALMIRERLIKGTDVVFECDDCPDANKCEWAFDPYNTDGDCLATK